MIELLGDVLAWFGDADNWFGTAGILNRLREHVQLTASATLISAALALPPALWLGHRRIGGTFVVALVNVGRAIPSFAIVVLFLPISMRLGLGIGFWPTFLALLFLAVPPMFTNTYTGVAGVDPDLVETSRGMGMTGRDVLTKVELPMASPVILAAIRVAAVQVAATATIGALVGWGGLGRFIVDGFANRDNVVVFAGAVLVTGLAIVLEMLLGRIEHSVVPSTLRSRSKGIDTIVA